MATIHREDLPRGEQGQPKDRPMKVQGDRPHSFRDEPIDPRTGLQGRPESPSDNPGQKTRDNVTPVIPSAEPGTGGIVDPTSLGMEQGGIPPAKPDARVNPEDLPPGHFNASVNEPPGSNVGGEGEGAGGEGEDAAPDLESLDPDEADAGDAADIVMHVHGTGFTAQSVIYFNGLQEPTTFVSETEVTTGVKPSLFVVPAVCPVTVRNGEHESDALEFEFLDPEDPPAARETKRSTRTTKAKTKPKKPAKKGKR